VSRTLAQISGLATRLETSKVVEDLHFVSKGCRMPAPGCKGGGIQVGAVDDLDQVIEQWRQATGEFVKGNPEPAQKLFSHRDDVTLANPLGPAVPEIGPVAHGWEQVAKTQEHASSQFRDGEGVDFEIVEKYVTPELACVVHVERMKVKVVESEDTAPIAMRVTMIFRPEDGTWKVVHRHADSVTTLRPAESVIQE
jgi:ketosteroid isomerase-like protein